MTAFKFYIPKEMYVSLLEIISSLTHPEKETKEPNNGCDFFKGPPSN